MLLDSSDRVAGTPFSFVCNMGSNINRARFIRLQKIVLPKFNNVNTGNNTFRIKSALGTTGIITLTPGFYNTTSLSNEITAQINARFVTDGFADTFVTAFDPITRSFSITSVGVNNFFIIRDSLLIEFGETLVPFVSELEATAVASAVVYSGVAAMLPTRYLILTSSSLSRNQFERSIVSSTTRQLSNVIAVIDLADIYNPQDWSIGAPFSGVYETILVDGGPISVQNSQDALMQYIDISILDGYKRNIGDLYNLSAPNPTSTTLSVNLIFEVIY
jgi:hypothetical protein